MGGSGEGELGEAISAEAALATALKALAEGDANLAAEALRALLKSSKSASGAQKLTGGRAQEAKRALARAEAQRGRAEAARRAYSAALVRYLPSAKLLQVRLVYLSSLIISLSVCGSVLRRM
jgi:hypothetical protein